MGDKEDRFGDLIEKDVLNIKLDSLFYEGKVLFGDNERYFYSYKFINKLNVEVIGRGYW
jgi:hypothetical protein